MAHLTDLFQKGNIPMVESETLRFVKDSRYRYQNLEAKLTQVGGRLIEQNQLQSGLFVLDLITKAYPQSAKAWLALAKVLDKANQPEKTALAHRKAGDLGGIEKNKGKMLESRPSVFYPFST
jgi:Flp pilus assembly protein TadD